MHIYPNKDIKIDLSFFEAEAADSAYIIVYKNSDKSPDLPIPVYPNRLSEMNISIVAKKGSDLYFKLFIEKDKANKLPEILHMTLLLSEV